MWYPFVSQGKNFTWLVLNSPLLSLTSIEGKRLYDAADSKADYEVLKSSFESQSLVSFCGVASGVSVLKAFGADVSQFDFFTQGDASVQEESTLPGMFKVMFSGMTLSELTGLLQRHEVRVDRFYASESSVDVFRATVESNLKTEENHMIVNYQREVLGQKKVGHLSPVGAYDHATDAILILDTASHKYPFTWVPLPLLFDAMNTVDQSSG